MSDSGSMVSLVTLWLDLSSGARALAGSEVEIATMPTNATAANESTNSRSPWTRGSRKGTMVPRSLRAGQSVFCFMQASCTVVAR